MNKLNENKTQNLISGFKKCGIYPLNKQTLLDRLPHNLTEMDNNVIGEAFLEQLEAKRSDYLGTGNVKRRKKLQVPAGKSITVHDVIINEEDPKPMKSNKTIKFKKTKRQLSTSSSDEELDAIMIHSDEISDFDLDSNSDEEPIINTNDEVKLNKNDLKIDDFVIVLFNENKYLGKIVSLSEKGPIVDCMFRTFKFWRWPEKKDAILYEWKDVLKKIDPPKIVSKRNQFSVSELDDFV